MSNLAKYSPVDSIKFENDLDKPLLGAIVKDPTVVGIAYFCGALGLCFVPGLGIVSAIALSLLGAMDTVATLKTDDDSGDEHALTFAPMKKITARLEGEQRAIAPVRPTEAAVVAYDDKTYTEPSPWGAPVKRQPQQPAPAPAGMPTPEEYHAANALVDARVKALGLDHDELLTIAEAKPIEPTVPPKTEAPKLDLARLMATPDDSGYYRSRLLTALTRTGKGLVTLTALTILLSELGRDLELFCIDAKADPNEAHRWAIVPTANRYQFSGGAPDCNPVSVKSAVNEITHSFYYSKAKYKFLIISELKTLMGTLGRVSKTDQRNFSTFLSSLACTGASSHRYVWIDTNVVGLDENGFNGAGDRDAFELDYLVKKEKQKQITGHKSFIGETNIPAKAFELSGRAFCSTSVEGWHPIPRSYDELDKTLREAHPPVIPMEPTPAKVEATTKEAEDLAFVCEQVLKCQGAIALRLDQIAEVHGGIRQMLSTPALKPSLLAALDKAAELELLRVASIGGVYTVSVSRCAKRRQV